MWQSVEGRGSSALRESGVREMDFKVEGNQVWRT